MDLLGSSDKPAITLSSTCEYDSCPLGSPAEGFNSSDTRLNYVNSYPVTSMRYGIQSLSPRFFNGTPNLAVAGFNVGCERSPSTSNLPSRYYFSALVGHPSGN